MTILIECNGINDYTVRSGERFISHLGWDEMLGTVIDLTHPGMTGKTRYVLRTPAEHAAWESAWDKNYPGMQAGDAASAEPVLIASSTTSGEVSV